MLRLQDGKGGNKRRVIQAPLRRIATAIMLILMTLALVVYCCWSMSFHFFPARAIRYYSITPFVDTMTFGTLYTRPVCPPTSSRDPSLPWLG